MIQYNEVIELKKQLETEYEDRHEAFRKLRNFWQGKYWEEEDQGAKSITSIFRDMRSNTTSTLPDMKLVNNLLQQVCVKFQTFISPLPQIRVYVDPPGSQPRRAQATLKERYLYGLWSAGNMAKVLTDIGWYLPLMGDCFLGSFPDMKNSLVKPILRSPENAYPVKSFDDKLQSVIFVSKVKESVIKRDFPDYVMRSDRNPGKVRWTRKKNNPHEIEVIEYSDNNEFSRWADGEKLNGVDHNFGFNIFDQIPFIPVPGEKWNHGAVEQAVNLVEMGNALYSLMFQAVFDNVFPMLKLIDPSKSPEEIEKGAGAVLPINAGGDAQYLVPPTGALLANANFLSLNEQNIKQATSMPDVNFGKVDASIITGKAINELQGAGTGSVVEMVQGTGIGSALVAWNEKAIYMGQNMFKDDTINLFGVETGSLADIRPRQFAISIKGSKLIGSPRNEVVFAPYLSMHEKVVMGLQMAGAGLVSKEWQRNQVGIPDSQAMDEEIFSEAIQDAVLGMIAQTIQTPENAEGAEEQAMAYLQGATPHPLTQTPANLAAAATPGGAAPGGGQPLIPATGIPMSVPLPTNQEAPAVSPGASQAPPEAQETIALTDAVALFQNLTDIQGRVFLVGEIVDTGQTSDVIEVAITEPQDRAEITDGLPQIANRMEFTHVEDVPSEKYVEVTPGIGPGEPVEPEGNPELEGLIA
jgi:hypothetical protein